jgi:hypothetical protein
VEIILYQVELEEALLERNMEISVFLKKQPSTEKI